MRIAFFHELPQGGARIATGQIASYLKKKNTVDLYYTDQTQKRGENQNYNKVHFFKFVPKEWRGGDWQTRLYKDTVERLRLRVLHKKIAKQIDDGRYDAAFVNASQFIESPFILSFLKTYKIFYMHDPHFRMIYEKELSVPEKLDPARATYEKLNRKVLKLVDLQNIKKADLILANSNYTQKTARASYGINSVVAYLGIDTDFFKPKKLKKSIDVLYVGSKDPLDGYSLFEKSLRKMKMKPRIKTIFKEKEWLSKEKMRDLYNHANIIICLGRNEPFGLIAIEAGACGIPVVALDEAGYKETVIDGKTGYLVAPGSQSIADKLDYLLTNTRKRTDMGFAARKNAVKSWDWKIRGKKLEELLKKKC